MKLTFYMKSGNKFTINGVNNWEVSSTSGAMDTITLTQSPPKWGMYNRLIVKSIDIKSVEAIVEEK